MVIPGGYGYASLTTFVLQNCLLACLSGPDLACLVRGRFFISSKPLNVTVAQAWQTAPPHPVMLEASTVQDGNCSVALFGCAPWPGELCSTR